MKCLKFKNSKIYKSVATTSLAVVLALSGLVTGELRAYAQDATFATVAATRIADQIGTRAATPRRGAPDMTITGEIPNASLTVLGAAALNIELNDRFVAQRDEFIQIHRARTPDLHFETETIAAGRYVSVIVNMEARGVNITRAVATTVINAETLEIISITDFNPNALQIVNGRLENKIALNPRLFIANFAGIDNNHPFYLDEDGLVVPFASGTLRISQREIENITFAFEDIQNEIIENEVFFALTAAQYSTIMVRLSDVVARFGFETEALTAPIRMNISRGGEAVTTVTVGRNAYIRDGETRQLETGPRLRRGEMYVPLTFFREILGLATTVIPDEYILISEWHGLE
ncbi:MAG: copper amine oxidase N-terminal domain-containing protein [Clostridiales bacterium]|jgi:hypothetical protein|nr:copper amine oxidase N-terminal domain-containing protein [Clostridiales bacterium]